MKCPHCGEEADSFEESVPRSRISVDGYCSDGTGTYVHRNVLGNAEDAG